jgi:hypothetical protein
MKKYLGDDFYLILLFLIAKASSELVSTGTAIYLFDPLSASSKSQSLTERSSLPVANILPSDEKTIDRTGLV